MEGLKKLLQVWIKVSASSKTEIHILTQQLKTFKRKFRQTNHKVE